MGRGRAPCCEKVGLNRGSWTPEEDMRLVAYIQKFGHGNWRSLPKRAGLLRCGKSCRLRWINYLRPDIKRGNFTKEEEETIIRLHGLLGNKWSKIASCLPGRTDNEIKNVWNTHLKKRITPKEQKNSMANKPEETPSSPSSTTTSCSDHSEGKSDSESTNPSVDSSNSSTEKIEIPVEPNMDNMWEILEDCLLSPQQETETVDGDMQQVNLGLEPNDLMKVSPSSSSSDFLAMNCDASAGDGQVLNDISAEEANEVPSEIPDMPIEPEIWNMIDDDGEAALFSPELGAMEGIGGQGSSTNLEQASSGEGEIRSEWLEYLEKELGLCGASDANNQENLVRDVAEHLGPWLDMEGDPVSSYFQKRASSPSPFDLTDLEALS